MRKKLINKKAKKKLDDKCYFCPVDDYELLDVHRILDGKYGGVYSEFNSITVCSLCHRKIHCGKIKVFRKYFSSQGGYVLHFIDENGVEQWR